MKEKLDQLIQRISQGTFSTEILEARKDYQKLAGEIYEDDKSYESRMGLFLEWYMFDRINPESRLTPLESLINDNGDEGFPEELKNLKEFSNNIHGLFIIKKIRDDEVVVLNLFNNKKYGVREPEGKILFQKNELIEGRIVLNNDEYYFTGNFCFHPKQAVKFIKSEVKNIVTLRDEYLKDLKKINSQLKDLNSQVEKNRMEIEKLNSKIQNSKSMEKIRAWNDQLGSSNRFRNDLVQQVSAVETEKSNLENEKLKIEINQLSNDLMQRLNYMNLIWGRSRQIDLQDIYRN